MFGGVRDNSPMKRHRQVQWIVALASVLAAAIAAFAQTGARVPADLDPDSRARLPYLQRKDMDAKSQALFDKLPGRGQDGVLRGPLAFAAYNPEAALALFDLHNAAVAGSLPPRVRELAILVACRETNYSLEWNAHQAIGTKVGLDAKLIDHVREHRLTATGIDEKDALVIRFGHQIFHDRKMDAATFAKAVEAFGRRGAMDLVAVMTTYAASGFYAIAVDEHMPPGRPDLTPVN